MIQNPHIHCPNCDLEMKMFVPFEFDWATDFQCEKCYLVFHQNGTSTHPIHEWYWRNEETWKAAGSGSSPEECVRFFKLKMFK
jgi:hypothetical protein